MSSIKTTAVLEYVKTRIITATGLPAAQVHYVDATNVDPSNLPDVVIYRLSDKPTGDEASDNSGGSRRIEFGVTISVASVQEADTDTLATQVRLAVLEDPDMGGLVFDSEWNDQEWGTGNGSVPTAMTKMVFQATYWWTPEWLT